MFAEPIAKLWVDERQSHFEPIFGIERAAWWFHGAKFKLGNGLEVGKPIAAHEFCNWLYYLFRNLGGMMAAGKLGFGGPDRIAENILTPLLNVHLMLVVLVFVLIPCQLWLGRRAAKWSGGILSLTEAPAAMKKSVWLNVLLPCTALFLAVGLVRCSSGYCWLFYIGAPILFAVGIGLVRLLEHLLPTGGMRHRMIGKITVLAIVSLFASTTGMYLMLHVLYPHAAS